MRKLLAAIVLAAFAASPLVYAQSTPTPSPSASATAKKRAKKSPSASPTASVSATATPKPAKSPKTKASASPAAAKSTGTPGKDQVWVNTESHVYHKPGSRFYGKTKAGKYVTEQEAVKEGDRAAKGKDQ